MSGPGRPLAWLGSTPIGGPIVGWVGQEAGARWSLVVGGLPTLVIGLVALPVVMRIDRRRGIPPPEPAGLPGWLPPFRRNARVAPPDQPVSACPVETSEANTTTELR
jgi:hypothetical protein